MLAKPDKWKAPEVYAAERLLEFRLYCDVHWVFGDRAPRLPNRRPQTIRHLKPEIKEWLDENKFPHKIRLGGEGKSRIVFEHKAHAMLFKLRWI